MSVLASFYTDQGSRENRGVWLVLRKPHSMGESKQLCAWEAEYYSIITHFKHEQTSHMSLEPFIGQMPPLNVLQHDHTGSYHHL